MIRMNLDPKDILVPENVGSDFDYVRAHLRETHDVWHPVTGFDTDVAGELGLQAFYLAQFQAPLLAAQVRLSMKWHFMQPKPWCVRLPGCGPTRNSWIPGRGFNPASIPMVRIIP